MPPRTYITPRPGTTYAVAAEPFDGWVKLGRSGPGVDPASRFRHFQTGNARQLRVRAIWPVDVERGLHDYFAPFRGRGEWFALPWRLLRDMDRFKNDPKPWKTLFAAWPAEAIYAEARLAVERLHPTKPEWLARAFMTVASSAYSDALRVRTSIPITEEMTDRALEALRPILARFQHVCPVDKSGSVIPGCGCAEFAEARQRATVKTALELAIRGIALDYERLAA